MVPEGGKKKVLKNVKKLSLRRYGTCLCLHAKNEASTVNVKVEVEVGVPPAARHAHVKRGIYSLLQSIHRP